MRFRPAYAIVGFAWISNPALAQNLTTRAPIDVVYPASGGASLGSGWDTLQHQKTQAVCIVGDTQQDKGQFKSITYQRIVDTDSLMRSLSVSAEAKANLMQGASVSGSVAYAKRTQVDTESVNIVANAVVIQGAEHVVPTGSLSLLSAELLNVPALAGFPTSSAGSDAVLETLRNKVPVSKRGELTRSVLRAIGGGQIMLTPEMARLAHHNPAQFRQQCGDGFVASLISGGSIQALYAFASRQSQDREDITLKMSGSFPIGSGSTSLTSIVEEISKHTKVTLTYNQLGGNGDPLPITQSELEGKVNALPEIVAASPSPMRMTVIYYENLPNFPFSTARDSGDLDVITSNYFRLSNIRFAVDEMLEHQDRYTFHGGPTVDEIRILQDKLETFRGLLEKAVRDCLVSKPCSFPREVDKDDYNVRAQLPIPKVSDPRGALLSSEETSIATYRAELERTPKEILITIPVGSVSSVVFITNQRYSELQAGINATSQHIAALKKDLSQVLVRERFDFWIDEPARQRCLQQFEPCLLNERMDKILAYMHISYDERP